MFNLLRGRSHVVTTTRWLTADQQRTWRSLVIAAQLLQEGLDRQLQRDAGMPHAYYGILVVLSESAGGTAKMSEVAASLGFSPSRLSHAVAKMGQNGWVVRTPCPDDRRSTFATITRAGRAALADAAPGHVDFVRRVVFGPLTLDEQHRLRHACDQIVAALTGEAAS
jgi:DNA-binding MarR family transcriptional regulator